MGYDEGNTVTDCLLWWATGETTCEESHLTALALCYASGSGLSTGKKRPACHCRPAGVKLKTRSEYREALAKQAEKKKPASGKIKNLMRARPQTTSTTKGTY